MTREDQAMPELPEQLVPRGEEVVAKILDGEAILMNVRTGVYYSMDGVGAFVWDQIERGSSPEEIGAAVTACYEVEAAVAAADVRRLVSELVAEGIVKPGPAKADRVSVSPPFGDSPLAYLRPRLKVYRDMGDLLALDPPAPSLADLRWEK